MSIRAVLSTAWFSIGANKLRSSLTLLGIVIGVSAVISLMAVGSGTQKSIIQRIESLGTNLLYVTPVRTSGSSQANLTLQDAYALVDPVYAPDVKAVAPELDTSAAITFQGQQTFGQVLGVTPEFLGVRNYTMASGIFISPAHVLDHSNVVVLGAQEASNLFGTRDPVGSQIRLNGQAFTVIGLLQSKGATALGNQDSVVLIPITTAYYYLSSSRTTQGDVNVSSINVEAVSSSAVNKAQQEITTILRLRHEITTQDDFTVTNQQDTTNTLQSTANSFAVFLGAIAGISLIVGGIGIMNIMLVSVTERTREIGVRKAVGAKRRDILLQFVSEATLLSLTGGIIGVGGGYLGSHLLNGRTIGGTALDTSFSWDVAILALAVSAAIGLFFGIYPAMRAAALHPIEALRYG